jgi:transcriptional regulator with XRE-family HTH domain
MPVMTKTPHGEDIVILSRAEYDALTAGRGNEDAVDAAHANSILANIERGTETLLTSEQADELLNAKTPLAFWRKHRGVTQQALSKSIGVAQGFISEMENGTKTGDVQTLAAIARFLAISLDDIVIAKAVKPAKRLAAGKRRAIVVASASGRRHGKPRLKKTGSQTKSFSAR